ncbi:MAG: flagellar type III secretion system pore protein FliP [Granulosicoccaceae bacterium]
MINRSVLIVVLSLLAVVFFPASANAADLPLLTLTTNEAGGQTWSLNIRILVLMTVLTLIPALVLSMTSFTRIIVVLAIMRQALGTQQTPSNNILLGLALFLSLFVMAPVLEQSYKEGIGPYLDDKLDQQTALQRGAAPLMRFMVEQTRETDIELFANIAGVEHISSPEATPFKILVPAFVISELKSAFQIGFLIFIPFVIIDLVVASVLMSMGMMMLSPMIISLPFKIMLFVLVDGWALISATLVGSFYGVQP